MGHSTAWHDSLEWNIQPKIIWVSNFVHLRGCFCSSFIHLMNFLTRAVTFAFTYFIDEVALLLMVKFSASEASELSKSPVRTLPDCWSWAAPGIICGCVAWVKPFDGTDGPDDPTGFSTSPKGSNPLDFFIVCVYACLVGFWLEMKDDRVWLCFVLFVLLMKIERVFVSPTIRGGLSEG